MTDRETDTPKPTTPITRIVKREDLLYPHERPTELCKKLEELRDWMDRSAHSRFWFGQHAPNLENYDRLIRQAAPYTA